MSDPVVTVTEEVNGETLQLPEDGHVGFSTAMSADASDWEFYLRKSIVRPSAPVRPSASPPVCQPVRPFALLTAPVRLFARPPIVRPRPLVRLACSAPSAHPPVRPSANPSAPSASFHPWSLAYKFLAVEAERAPSV